MSARVAKFLTQARILGKGNNRISLCLHITRRNEVASLAVQNALKDTTMLSSYNRQAIRHGLYNCNAKTLGLPAYFTLNIMLGKDIGFRKKRL